MGGRLWDVLVDLLPEHSPLLMQCTNVPFPAPSPFPAVNERSLTTPPCSLGRGSSMCLLERVNLAPSLEVFKVGCDLEQPGLVESARVHGRGVGMRCFLRSFPIQTIL